MNLEREGRMESPGGAGQGWRISVGRAESWLPAIKYKCYLVGEAGEKKEKKKL